MLKPKIQRLADQFIEVCKAQGIIVVITEGFRSIERQNELYAQGRTKAGQIVTNAKGGQSFHNYGVAFDVCFIINGKASYSGDWDKLGAIGESIGLEWGGHWVTFKDRPHFQWTGGYKISDFISNKVDYSKFN